jgi:Lrp/AsnC family transcriptional regulator, leucine-responsive regulatory protein
MADVHLDSTDKRILTALQRDGRMSTVDLAAAIGLSPTPIARRLRELETSGVIQGYTAVVDPRKVGSAIQAVVQIKLEQHTDEAAERFQRTMAELPQVSACYAMTGDMDFLLHVAVRDVDALSDFTLRRLLRIPGVRDMRTSIVLQTVKRGLAVPIE